jgi:hypothetical protein
VKKHFTAAVLMVGLFVVSAPLFAHHGNAAYDYDKTVTVKGVVTEWIFGNPHCFVKFDAKDEKGEIQHWTVETGAAAYSQASGWSKTSLKPGDEVTVDIMPAKNGLPIGRMRRVILPDGKILKGDTRFTI